MTRPRTKDIIDPNYPLLEANRNAIEAISKDTFSYGSPDGQQLDVYYPPPTDVQSVPPTTMVFLYGGGLTSSSRSNSPSNLVHNNLGAFFASRGFFTVIPDYRLVPSVIFPQGSEDIQAVIKWVVDRFPERAERLFVMGHSAGGLHLATLLLSPTLFTPIAPFVHGVVLLGVPVAIPPGGNGFPAAALHYYGSSKAITKNQPLGLLRRAETEYVARLPPMRATRAGSEPRYITAGMRTFVEEYVSKGGIVVDVVLEGHDHLSPVLALSAGSGEEWGDEVVKWMQDVSQGPLRWEKSELSQSKDSSKAV